MAGEYDKEEMEQRVADAMKKLKIGNTEGVINMASDATDRLARAQERMDQHIKAQLDNLNEKHHPNNFLKNIQERLLQKQGGDEL